MSASAALQDKPDATATGATHDEFLTHMKAMTAHYTAKGGARPKTTYALPVHLVHPVGEVVPAAAAAGAGKAAVDAALRDGQARTTAFATHQKDVVGAATTKLQKDNDTTAFQKQMQAYEDQAQQQAHDTIHQQYKVLTDLGLKHPEQQKRILSTVNQIGAFFTNLLVSVGQFFADIAKKIVAWIAQAVKWVENAAASVGKWVSGAVSSIGHFFSSLF